MVKVCNKPFAISKVRFEDLFEQTKTLIFETKYETTSNFVENTWAEYNLA